MVTRDPTTGMLGMESALKRLTDHWWLLLLQGVVSIIIGVLALVWPGHTLAVLIVLFGWLTLLNGVVAVVSALGAAASGRSWGWRFAAGLVGVLVGLIILRWPGATALTVLLFVGFWAIMVGLMQIIGAVVDHAVIPHAGLLALDGVVALLFGIAMVVWPGAGLLTLAWLIGIYALVHGLLYCAIALRVRSLGQHLPVHTPSQTSGGRRPAM